MRLAKFLIISIICCGLLPRKFVLAGLPSRDQLRTAVRQLSRKGQSKGRRNTKLLASPTSVSIESAATISPGLRTARGRGQKSSEVLSLLLPWLYFTAISVNIPNLPKYINWSINRGNSNVSSESAAVYGTLSGIKALFTFQVVNLIGCMSDSFGRRPFMMLSACGLGSAYMITLHAKSVRMFYIAAMIDGLTSCMFSRAHSYVTDMN